MISVPEYLNKKGFIWKEQRGEAIMNCPFCDDREKKFAVGLKNGAFNCYHLNNCGVKGSFRDLQRLLGDEPERLYSEDVFASWKPKRNYTIPKTVIEKPQSSVIDYLRKRGFTDDTISHFKVGAKDNDTVMLPYFKGGALVNVKYRSISDKHKMWTEKGAEPVLFNRDQIFDETLVICEGEYDAMALHQYGIEAVSVPMGAGNFQWIESEWDYLETFKVIYICFDGDNAGLTAAKELVHKLGAWRCRGVVLPFKDANECLVRNVSKEDIEVCFNGAIEYIPATLANPSQFENEIQELFKNPHALEGTPTPWDKLTQILKGWRNDELTIWSGRNGAGKSTILNQVVIDLAHKGIRSCVASLEMPAKRYLRWAIIQSRENSNPAPVAISETLQWFNNKIFVVNTHEEVTPKELMEVFEYAARRYDVKHFVIDSLMRISLPGGDELSEQKSFVSGLLSFCKKFNCHVHLVAHPRKGAKDTEKPGKVDVRGSSHITDLAHNVLIVWRPEDEEKEEARTRGKSVSDMVLYVKKNREFGTEGGVKMYFNEQAKKFRDVL
jgi:twinkle protein